MEELMRKIVISGVAAVVLAASLTAANAAYAGNIDPRESPYAILAPQTVAPAPALIAEGRSAYVGGDQGDRAGYAVQHPFADCPSVRVRMHGVWRDAKLCD
jgi:hypothetical protein